METPDKHHAIAAIVHSGSDEADSRLREFARRLQSQGCVVRGLVAGARSASADRYTRTVMDLENGVTYPINQDLGQGSKACCLNPSALLAAGIVLRRALENNADLIIVNRYGALEAEGRGFSAEMLEFMSRGYPLLTIVSSSCLDAWRTFTGGMATELPPEIDAMADWFRIARLAVCSRM